MAGLQTLRIRPGYGGLNTVQQPRDLAAAESSKLENMLPGVLGLIRMRGCSPSTNIPTTVANPVSPQLGTLTFNDKVAICRTTTGVTDVSYYTAPGDAVVTSFTAAGAQTVLGPSVMVPTVADVDNSYFVNNSTGHVARWAGAGAIVDVTTGPSFVTCVASHLRRLFASDGRSLFYTDPGGCPTNVAGEWQDDVTGLTNRIVLGLPVTDTVVAMVQVGRHLAILGSSSIYLLTGDTPATFVVHTISNIKAPTTSAGVPAITLDDRAYFVAPAGLYVFDGVTAQELSTAIRTDLRQAIGASGSIISLARIGNDAILLCVYDSSGGTSQIWMLHLATNTWSTVVYSASAVALPQLVGNTANYVWLWDGSRCHAIVSGSQSRGLVFPELDGANAGFDTGSGTTKAIATKWWSKVYDLAAPTYKVQLHRVMVEYDLRNASAAFTGSNGLYVSLYDSLGTQLLPPTALAPGTTRQRAVIDVFAETSDVQVRIEYANTVASNITKLEIYDCWVEYQQTRQRG